MLKSWQAVERLTPSRTVDAQACLHPPFILHCWSLRCGWRWEWKNVRAEHGLQFSLSPSHRVHSLSVCVPRRSGIKLNPVSKQFTWIHWKNIKLCLQNILIPLSPTIDVILWNVYGEGSASPQRYFFPHLTPWWGAAPISNALGLVILPKRSSLFFHSLNVLTSGVICVDSEPQCLENGASVCWPNLLHFHDNRANTVKIHRCSPLFFSSSICQLHYFGYMLWGICSQSSVSLPIHQLYSA